jgi:hypothetical protein
VWDATGLFSAISGGLTAGGTVTGGAFAATENFDFNSNTDPTKTKFLPIGAGPIVTTTWNTTTIAPGTVGTNPSGTLPLIADSIGGSPMPDGPFPANNANFDFTNLLVVCVDSACGEGQITGTTPANGAPTNAAITVSFSRQMQADTVAAAISMVDVTNGNANIPVTVTPNTGLASTFTIAITADRNPVTPAVDLEFNTTYRVTLDPTNVLDEDGAALQPSPNNTWAWTTTASTAQVCVSDVIGPQPLGSNFTMLNPSGDVLSGGTNDIEYDFGNGLNSGHNPAILNTSAAGTLGIMTNMMRSAKPEPFSGEVWTAHHIRLFGPGTYVINTECSAAQLEAGTCGANPDNSKNLTMTVGASQIGAHMLFDWSNSSNIDVLNVWDLNTTWTDNVPTAVNNLFDGPAWAGPVGYTVHPQTTWGYVSVDADGDGINGVGMIDGPFPKFRANFNLNPAFSCLASPPQVVSIEDITSVGGCSLGAGNANPAARGDWWLVAGFLAWLGLIRKRLARQRS